MGCGPQAQGRRVHQAAEARRLAGAACVASPIKHPQPHVRRHPSHAKGGGRTLLSRTRRPAAAAAMSHFRRHSRQLQRSQILREPAVAAGCSVRRPLPSLYYCNTLARYSPGTFLWLGDYVDRGRGPRCLKLVLHGGFDYYVGV